MAIFIGAVCAYLLVKFVRFIARTIDEVEEMRARRTVERIKRGVYP